MKARWIRRDPSPSGGILGQAIIASWWPCKYYFCHTIQLDTSSDLAKLTYCLDNKGVKFHDVPYEVTSYVTCVFRCDKHGIVDNLEFKPFFIKSYAIEEQAKAGHEDIIEKLMAGKLRDSPPIKELRVDD